MKNLKQSRKKQMHILAGIFIFVTIVLSNFFKMHYAQDTYHEMANGYSQTAKGAFLYSGRPISAGVFYIADYLNLSMDAIVFIMTCISIVNLTLAVYFLFKTITNLLKTKENKNLSAIILIISFLSIFNFCTMDLLVFAESGVLTLGLLFSVMSGCVWASDKKNKYLRIVLYSLIAVLCYQGILNIYVPLALIIIASKNDEDKGKAFKQAFMALFLYGFALILSMLVSKLISSILVINSRQTILPAISHIINTYLKYIKILLVNTMDIGPKYWYVIIIGFISLLYLIGIIKYKYPKIYFLYYIAILLSAILLPILPLVIQEEKSQYIEPRMAVSFGASIGLMLLYIILTIKIEKYTIVNRIIEILSIVLFVFNCQYAIQSSGEMIATNLLDRNIAMSILNEIDKYEKESNITIKKIGIDYDTNLKFYYEGSDVHRCLNLKSLATDWAIEPILEVYGNRKLEGVEVPKAVHDKYFAGKDWDCYDKEQLVFVDDTLYICIY